jgi:alpha-N-acetylglucosamine transferase
MPNDQPMTIREILNYAFLFVLYVVLQILIVRNLVLFDYAFCFVYIAAIILLPYELSMLVYLLIAFVTGVVVDTFYNTLGMHAAASVLMAYARPLVTRVLVDQPGQEFRVELTLQEMGTRPFFRYVLTMALIHHAALFFIEASSLSLFVPTLIRAVASAVLTTVSVVLIQFFTRN